MPFLLVQPKKLSHPNGDIFYPTGISQHPFPSEMILTSKMRVFFFSILPLIFGKSTFILDSKKIPLSAIRITKKSKHFCQMVPLDDKQNSTAVSCRAESNSCSGVREPLPRKLGAHGNQFVSLAVEDVEATLEGEAAGASIRTCTVA